MQDGLLRGESLLDRNSVDGAISLRYDKDAGCLRTHPITQPRNGPSAAEANEYALPATGIIADNSE